MILEELLLAPSYKHISKSDNRIIKDLLFPFISGTKRATVSRTVVFPSEYRTFGISSNYPGHDQAVKEFQQHRYYDVDGVYECWLKPLSPHLEITVQ